MSFTDVYGRTDCLDGDTLDAIATRLDARRESTRYMDMLHEYLDLLDLKAARRVLVLGCGTGVEVRVLVEHPEFDGHVTALDVSEPLVLRAEENFRAAGIVADVRWSVGDARALELADGQFDLVVAHTLISHVPDPGRVVEEAARVTRPGGTVVVFDGDHATLTFGTLDLAEGRNMDDKIVDALIANPRIMRSLPRLAKRTGLRLTDSRAWVLSEVGVADFFLPALHSYRRLLPAAGVLTSEEADAFVADPLRTHGDGTFFAATSFHAMVWHKKIGDD